VLRGVNAEEATVIETIIAAARLKYAERQLDDATQRERSSPFALPYRSAQHFTLESRREPEGVAEDEGEQRVATLIATHRARRRVVHPDWCRYLNARIGFAPPDLNEADAVADRECAPKRSGGDRGDPLRRELGHRVCR
jgi:hypothetical protein